MNNTKSMIEHIDPKTAVEITPIAGVAAKKYLLMAAVIMFGAVSHAIEDARKNGWKGMGWFCANIFVAGFVGMMFSQIASLISVDWMFVSGGVGGYMGPVAFKYNRSATLSRLGINENNQSKI